MAHLLSRPGRSSALQRLLHWVAGGALVVLLAASLHGAVRADTLARIANSGRITLGAHDASIPLSYLGPDGRHIGYHVDVCERIVEAIRGHLGLRSLNVVTVPTTIATRFSLLNNGSIDIECAHNVINAASRSQALLSDATMVAELRFMTTTAHPGLTLGTLGGRTIGVTAGGSAPAALRALARQHGFVVKESFGKRADELFARLAAGSVDAIVLPAPYVMAQRALAPDPERFRLLEEILLSEPLGLMLRLEDEALLKLVNQTLAGLMQSGELQRMYDKWFVQVIPGLPRPVASPMPPALRARFASPGDTASGSP